MKLKRRKIKRGRVEIIPMIDTIVILLIFYMTFSRFTEATRDAKIELPESVAGDEFKKLPNHLIINMVAADQITVGGEPFKVTDLPSLIGAIKARDPEMATMSIILRGDRAMNYTDLSEFMRACSKAGVADVAFTTLERQGPR
jgi:biopolymer transport protein ExbD